jgi:hypothetical protein
MSFVESMLLKTSGGDLGERYRNQIGAPFVSMVRAAEVSSIFLAGIPRTGDRGRLFQWYRVESGQFLPSSFPRKRETSELKLLVGFPLPREMTNYEKRSGSNLSQTVI